MILRYQPGDFRYLAGLTASRARARMGLLRLAILNRIVLAIAASVVAARHNAMQAKAAHSNRSSAEGATLTTLN